MGHKGENRLFPHALPLAAGVFSIAAEILIMACVSIPGWPLSLMLSILMVFLLLQIMLLAWLRPDQILPRSTVLNINLIGVQFALLVALLTLVNFVYLGGVPFLLIAGLLLLFIISLLDALLTIILESSSKS